jgi:hypothetical protein
MSQELEYMIFISYKICKRAGGLQSAQLVYILHIIHKYVCVCCHSPSCKLRGDCSLVFGCIHLIRKQWSVIDASC